MSEEQESFSFVLNVTGMVNYFAGNLDALGGLGPLPKVEEDE
jgi:hypothetical protein